MEGIPLWIVTIVVGGLIGWVASILMRTNAQMGLVANIVVGVVGALIGKWLAASVTTKMTSATLIDRA